MRGFDIGPIRWVTNEWGYQRIKLPNNVQYDSKGRNKPPALRNSHVKIWRLQPNGNRVFVHRVDTVAKARAYIRKARSMPLFEEPA